MDAQKSLPELWVMSKLGDQLIRSEKRINPSSHPNNEFIYVGLEHIQSGTGELLEINYATGSEIKSTKNKFQAGNILYGKLRPNLNKVYLSNEEGVCSTDIWVFDVQPTILPEYAAYYLRSQIVVERTTQLATGANLPRVNAVDFDSLPIPLPPLPEQQRIVAILRQADDLRRQQQAALEEAQKLIPAIFHKMFGDLSDWNDTIPLKNLVEFVGGGTPSRKVEEYFAGEIPWATSKDIKSRYLLDTEEHITQEAVENSSTKLVPEGSILLVVKSKILMHSLPMGITTRPFCFGQDLKGLVPIQGNSSQFIVAALQAQKQNILSRSRGVNTEGLTLSALRTIPIPNISIAQQQEFDARVAVADHLIEQNATRLLQITLLFESILTSAFAGNLTAQWRETNLAELTLAASDRDRLLGNSMKYLLTLPTGPGKTESALMYIFWHRKELKSTFSELQRRLLLSISKFSETYFTPQIVKAQEGLHDLSLNAITRAFDLFEKLGLLVRVSLPVAPAGVEYAYFETFFRLPTPADQGLETAAEISA